jgi:hypothetical protein
MTNLCRRQEIQLLRSPSKVPDILLDRTQICSFQTDFHKNPKHRIPRPSGSRAGTRDGLVVEALRYKPEGRGIDFRWCHWNFSLTKSFRLNYGPGVDSAFNMNEYQEYFLGVKAAGG